MRALGSWSHNLQYSVYDEVPELPSFAEVRELLAQGKWHGEYRIIGFTFHEGILHVAVQQPQDPRGVIMELPVRDFVARIYWNNDEHGPTPGIYAKSLARILGFERDDERGVVYLVFHLLDEPDVAVRHLEVGKIGFDIDSVAKTRTRDFLSACRKVWRRG